MKTSKQPTILHVLSSAEIAGGERHVNELINNADPQFQHLVVLPYSGPFEELLKNQLIEYKVIDMTRKIALFAIAKLVTLIRKKKIQVIHTHGYRANFYGRIAALLTRKRSIATIHVSLLDYAETSLILRKIYIFLEKFLGFLTDSFICISKTMAIDMILIGTPEKKINLIPNGVDLNRFRPKSFSIFDKSIYGIGKKDRLIGSFGRMVPEKGHRYLIDALSILNQEGVDLKCLFLGDGPLLPVLKRRVVDNNLEDKCIFGGIRNDIEEIYPMLDLFVLPSIREPFGLVLLEAMASGVPVIATGSGGPNEFIKSGKNGILIPPKNPNKMAEGIKMLLQDKEKACSIASSGRKTVQEQFEIRKAVQQTHQIYLALIEAEG